MTQRGLTRKVVSDTTHLMSENTHLANWLLGEGRTAASLAQALEISRGHLSHIMSGRFRPSAELAVRIERETAGAVKRAALRPDLFGDVQAEGAAA